METPTGAPEMTDDDPTPPSGTRVDVDVDVNGDREPGRDRRGPIQRRRDWSAREWDGPRIWRFALTAFSLVFTTTIVMNVVHLNPLSPGSDLIFDDNTPTGGDFGAHVWGPAFLRDHLLPSWRLNGWSMDWYAGMPVYRFYMVLPALAIVLVDTVLPYGVAMKLVGVIGLITFPIACWAFGRLARFAYPIPEMFAFAGLAFVLDESFTIYGGNLKSTMAGEFSFSIALSLAMFGLGYVAAGLRTGRYRVRASILIAAACVSHGIVLLFVVAGALVWTIVWLDRRRLVWAVTVGLTSVLLLLWWAGPFVLNHEYMTDMKYGPRPEGLEDSFWDMFFPLTTALDFIITGLAVIGVAWSLLRRHLDGVALAALGLVLCAGVYLARDSLPVIGLLWNPRLLPFVYLVRYLLMMVGLAAVLRVGWNTVVDRRAATQLGARGATASGLIGALGVLIVVGFMYQVLPGGGLTSHNGVTVYGWGPFKGTQANVRASGDGWASYNFTGYEGRGAAYAEYHSIVTTMDDLGAQRGCGRALWENSPDNGQYGTTMALMLLPFWTDGCIGSMEAVYFEASGTTPYSFLATAALSKQSSNPVRELRYVDNDGAVAVDHLQDLGVRYAMARTPEAKAELSAQPELTLVASSPPWNVYEVSGADLVVGLERQPVVVRERSGDQRERHLELGTSWFQSQADWPALPADDGPESWQRLDAVIDLERRQGEPGERGRRVDIVVPATGIEVVDLPEVTISDVEVAQQSMTFRVDRPGVPVLIRMSYFPNWDVTGADGPYRVAPNSMVVVPTAEQVTLTYGRSAVDIATLAATLTGIGLCVFWRRRGDVEVDEVEGGEIPGPEAEPRSGAPVEHPEVVDSV